jgi:hypothetical protein
LNGVGDVVESVRHGIGNWKLETRNWKLGNWEIGKLRNWEIGKLGN